MRSVHMRRTESTIRRLSLVCCPLLRRPATQFAALLHVAGSSSSGCVGIRRCCSSTSTTGGSGDAFQWRRSATTVTSTDTSKGCDNNCGRTTVTAYTGRRRAPFQFSKFAVDDSDCAMRVGTDGVLLGLFATYYECCPLSTGRCDQSTPASGSEGGDGGENDGGVPLGVAGFAASAGGAAWCAASPPAARKAVRVLDVGVGCGLVSLVVCQRLHEEAQRLCASSLSSSSEPDNDCGGEFRVVVVGVDIDAAAVGQAERNFRAAAVRNGWCFSTSTSDGSGNTRGRNECMAAAVSCAAPVSAVAGGDVPAKPRFSFSVHFVGVHGDAMTIPPSEMLQSLPGERDDSFFDLVVSNPPFFAASGMLPPRSAKKMGSRAESPRSASDVAGESGVNMSAAMCPRRMVARLQSSLTAQGLAHRMLQEWLRPETGVGVVVYPTTKTRQRTKNITKKTTGGAVEKRQVFDSSFDEFVAALQSTNTPTACGTTSSSSRGAEIGGTDDAMVGRILEIVHVYDRPGTQDPVRGLVAFSPCSSSSVWGSAVAAAAGLPSARRLVLHKDPERCAAGRRPYSKEYSELARHVYTTERLS